MSQFHYLGSPVPIGVGVYGSNCLDIETVEIIDSGTAVINGTLEIKAGILDFSDKDGEWFKQNLLIFRDGIAAGLYISDFNQHSDAIRKHLKSRYIYEIQMNCATSGIKNLDDETLIGMRMDKSTLVELMKNSGVTDGFFELFSSWADEEGEPLDESKVQHISLEELEQLEYLLLDDRHYIKVDI